MSIEKKSLISNSKLSKKASLTKVNTNAQVAKVAAPKLNLPNMKLAIPNMKVKTF
jgi:hypothetical protein